MDNKTIQLGTATGKGLVFTAENKKTTYAILSKELVKLLCLIEGEEDGGRSALPYFDSFMYFLSTANVLCGNSLLMTKAVVKIAGLYENGAYQKMSHSDIKRQVMDAKAIIDHLGKG